MRSGSGNNFEIIFPSLFDEEKNQRYEEYIRKANEIWDEFTTGTKSKKKVTDHTTPEQPPKPKKKVVKKEDGKEVKPPKKAIEKKKSMSEVYD